MTNLIALRSIEEFKAGYTPGYNPLLPLFMAIATQYAMEVGNAKFTRLEAIGDLEGKFLGPKDTEMHQISARHGSKNFLKYFFGSQYIQSQLQSREGYEDVVAQVLDAQNKQADKLFMTGEAVAMNDATKNAGLFYSNDPNYTLENSEAIASTGGHLPGIYNLVATELAKADEIDGEKIVLFYGSTMTGKVDGLMGDNYTPFMRVLADGLPNAKFNKIPNSIVPTGNGFIIVNMSQVRLHYTMLPDIVGQGINEEKMYAWTNFLIGSMMLEVLAKDGVIRQPTTFAS